MAGASQSRLSKAGGNAQLAAQSLAQEYAAGAPGWSAEQKAAYANPATRDAWVAQQIGQSTKGKYSGVLGGAVKLIGKVAPYAALAIPGLGVLGAAGLGAAGGLARGEGVGGALKGAAMGGIGAGALGKLGGAAAGGATAGAPAAGGILGRIGGAISQDPWKAAQVGLAGLGMIQGASQQGKANKINDQLLGSLQGDETARLQLRQLALGRLMQGRGAAGNPFSQYGTVN